MSDEQNSTAPTEDQAVAAEVESTFDPEHPVRKPPFAFSEGEEVTLPDGVKGKVVSIKQEEGGTVTYSVATLSVTDVAEADLQTA